MVYRGLPIWSYGRLELNPILDGNAFKDRQASAIPGAIEN